MNLFVLCSSKMFGFPLPVLNFRYLTWMHSVKGFPMSDQYTLTFPTQNFLVLSFVTTDKKSSSAYVLTFDHGALQSFSLTSASIKLFLAVYKAFKFTLIMSLVVVVSSAGN